MKRFRKALALILVLSMLLTLLVPAVSEEGPIVLSSQGAKAVVTEKKDTSKTEDKKEEASDKKEEPSEKKEETSDKKEEPSEKKEEASEKKEETSEKKEETSEKKEETSEKKEETSEKKEETSEKKEEPSEKKEEPSEKQEEPSEKKEETSEKQEETPEKKEEPAEKQEETSEKQEAPAEKQEETTEKHDEPVQEPAIIKEETKTESAPTEKPVDPSAEKPAEQPTEAPAEQPTEAPVEQPTEAPVEQPTEAPVEQPTEAPAEQPTEAPVEQPTEAPVEQPTEAPAEQPTEAPAKQPTEAPTEAPTAEPTEEPVEVPTAEPTLEPEVEEELELGEAKAKPQLTVEVTLISTNPIYDGETHYIDFTYPTGDITDSNGKSHKVTVTAETGYKNVNEEGYSYSSKDFNCNILQHGGGNPEIVISIKNPDNKLKISRKGVSLKLKENYNYSSIVGDSLPSDFDSAFEYKDASDLPNGYALPSGYKLKLYKNGEEVTDTGNLAVGVYDIVLTDDNVPIGSSATEIQAQPNFSYTFTGGQFEVVDNAVTVTLKNDFNYFSTYGSSLPGDFASAFTLSNPDATLTGYYLALTDSQGAEIADVSTAAAGHYNIILTNGNKRITNNTEEGDYKYTFTGGANAYEVKGKPVTVSLNGTAKQGVFTSVYGNPAADGLANAFTVDVEGAIPQGYTLKVSGVDSVATADVGEYDVVLANGDSVIGATSTTVGNYAYTFAAGEKVYEITPASATVTLNTDTSYYTSVYGSNEKQGFAASYVLDPVAATLPANYGLQVTDTTGTAITVSTADVGSYNIVLTDGETPITTETEVGNYKYTFSAGQNAYSITRKPVVVSLNTDTVTDSNFGQLIAAQTVEEAYHYDTDCAALPANFVLKLDNAGQTVDYLNIPTLPVVEGGYPIKLVGGDITIPTDSANPYEPTDDEHKNYSYTFAGGIYTITPLPVTLSLTGTANKYFGQLDSADWTTETYLTVGYASESSYLERSDIIGATKGLNVTVTRTGAATTTTPTIIGNDAEKAMTYSTVAFNAPSPAAGVFNVTYTAGDNYTVIQGTSDIAYTINELPVTLTMTGEDSKYFGQLDDDTGWGTLLSVEVGQGIEGLQIDTDTILGTDCLNPTVTRTGAAADAAGIIANRLTTEKAKAYETVSFNKEGAEQGDFNVAYNATNFAVTGEDNFTYTINALPVTLKMAGTPYKFYGQLDSATWNTFLGAEVTTENVIIDAAAILGENCLNAQATRKGAAANAAEILANNQTTEAARAYNIISYNKTGADQGDFNIAYNVQTTDNGANFVVTELEAQSTFAYTIKALPVTLRLSGDETLNLGGKGNPQKVYGTLDSAQVEGQPILTWADYAAATVGADEQQTQIANVVLDSKAIVGDLGVTVTRNGAAATKEEIPTKEKEKQGSYTYNTTDFTITPAENGNYAPTVAETSDDFTFTIGGMAVTLSLKGHPSKIYGQLDKEDWMDYILVTRTDGQSSVTDKEMLEALQVKVARKNPAKTAGEFIGNAAEDVGAYDFTDVANSDFTLSYTQDADNNYVVTVEKATAEDFSYAIEPLPVKLSLKGKPEKLYGETDDLKGLNWSLYRTATPDVGVDETVDLAEQDILTDINMKVVRNHPARTVEELLVNNKDYEQAGEYDCKAFTVTFDGKEAKPNYAASYVEPSKDDFLFTIRKLPVELSMIGEAGKTYGQLDSVALDKVPTKAWTDEAFTKLTWANANSASVLRRDDIMAAMGVAVKRVNAATKAGEILGNAAEAAGTYSNVTYNSEETGAFSVAYDAGNNYAVTTPASTVKLTINKLKLGMALDKDKTYGELDDAVTGKGTDWTAKTTLKWDDEDKTNTLERKDIVKELSFKVVREDAADEGNKTIVGRASEQCGEYKATFNGQDRVKGYFAVTWSHDDNYDIKADSADLKLTIKKLKVGMKLDSEKTYGQLDDVVTGKGADWTGKTDLVWTEKDNVLTREMIAGELGFKVTRKDAATAEDNTIVGRASEQAGAYQAAYNTDTAGDGSLMVAFNAGNNYSLAPKAEDLTLTILPLAVTLSLSGDADANYGGKPMPEKTYGQLDGDVGLNWHDYLTATWEGAGTNQLDQKKIIDQLGVTVVRTGAATTVEELQGGSREVEAADDYGYDCFAIAASDANYDVTVAESADDFAFTINPLELGLALTATKTYGQLDDVVTGAEDDWTALTEVSWDDEDNALRRENILDELGFSVKRDGAATTDNNQIVEIKAEQAGEYTAVYNAEATGDGSFLVNYNNNGNYALEPEAEDLQLTIAKLPVTLSLSGDEKANYGRKPMPYKTYGQLDASQVQWADYRVANWQSPETNQLDQAMIIDELEVEVTRTGAATTAEEIKGAKKQTERAAVYGYDQFAIAPKAKVKNYTVVNAASVDQKAFNYEIKQLPVTARLSLEGSRDQAGAVISVNGGNIVGAKTRLVLNVNTEVSDVVVQETVRITSNSNGATPVDSALLKVAGGTETWEADQLTNLAINVCEGGRVDSPSMTALSLSLPEEEAAKGEQANDVIQYNNIAFDYTGTDLTIDNEANKEIKATFENRGDTITITLPEPGTLDSVSVSGTDVGTTASNAEGDGSRTDYTVSYTAWQASPELIKSGSDITVAYTDSVGNKCAATGAGSVAKSNGMPIVINMDTVADDSDGTVGGGTVKVYGEATNFETVNLTGAGSASAEVSGSAPYGGLNTPGQWETTISIGENLSNGKLTVKAAYEDLNGAAERTFNYKAEVMPVMVTSPALARYDKLYGFAEYGTNVHVTYNGEDYNLKKNKDMFLTGDAGNTVSTYQFFPTNKADSFFYWIFQTPKPMEASDEIEVWYVDFTGSNQSKVRWAVKVVDQGEFTTTAEMLGANVIDRRDEESMEHHFVAPVDLDALRGGEALELPVLAYDGYKLGTITLSVNEEGMLVLTPDVKDDTEDALRWAVKLFGEKPAMESLRFAPEEEMAEKAINVNRYGQRVWISVRVDATLSAMRIGRLDDFCALAPSGKTESRLEAYARNFAPYYQRYSDYLNVADNVTETEGEDAAA